MTLKICRLCLRQQELLYNVFNCEIEELSQKIFKYTAVQILKDDGLPNGVCSRCIQTITQFDLFSKQCQQSDRLIRRNLLQNKKLTFAENHVDQDVCCNTVANIDNIHCVGVDLPNNSVRIRDPSCYSEGNDCQIEVIFRSLKAIGNKNCKLSETDRQSSSCDLDYMQKDCSILGQGRKVKIYEVDDTIREIIGNNIYTCDICTMDFQYFFDYYDHQEVHNGELVFNCNRCSKVFSSRQQLVNHDARHKIPCKICELEVLPKSMSAHLLIHTDLYKCPECGMRHTSNASLEKHVKARHIGIKGFVCHICGKQSSCQSSMNRHMAYHSTDRPYKCKYCDFCAKSLNIVQVHTSRKHFAEKCVCEICAKLFKSQPSLIQHMKRIHTARKHICDICGKAFIERYNLNRHLKKHAGQRLHECKLCHKEFFTVRKLKEHMHSHRQGCVKCPKCGKEFFYKKYYNKHILKCTETVAINVDNREPIINYFK